MKPGTRKIIALRFGEIGKNLTEMQQQLTLARNQIEEEGGSSDKLKRIKQLEKQVNTTEVAFLKAADTWGAVLSDDSTSPLASVMKNTK
jgi:hypothetical protein